jgi:hypothetical protein
MVLLAHIRERFRLSRETYGSPIATTMPWSKRCSRRSNLS